MIDLLLTYGPYGEAPQDVDEPGLVHWFSYTPAEGMATNKTAADKLDIVCMGMANRLADIITSVDDDELNEIPAKLTGILTAVKLMQSELEAHPDRAMDLVVALSTALSRRLKIFL